MKDLKYRINTVIDMEPQEEIYFQDLYVTLNYVSELLKDTNEYKFKNIKPLAYDKKENEILSLSFDLELSEEIATGFLRVTQEKE